MFVYKNENPKNKRTTDCVVRAITTATGMSYEEVARGLLESSLKSGFAFNDKRNYRKFLAGLGFVKKNQKKKEDGSWLSVEELGKEIVNGLIHTRGHLTCVLNGNVVDTFDCTKSKAGMYFVKVL